MTSFKPYSFDEMLVKERQDDLWRQAEQARQRHRARQATRGARAPLPGNRGLPCGLETDTTPAGVPKCPFGDV